MNTRRVIIIFAAFALLVSATALWDAQGDELDGDTASNVVASSGAESGADAPAPKKKGGGLFGKILQGAVQGGRQNLREGRRRRQGRAHEREGRRAFRERRPWSASKTATTSVPT